MIEFEPVFARRPDILKFHVGSEEIVFDLAKPVSQRVTKHRQRSAFIRRSFRFHLDFDKAADREKDIS